MNKQLSGAILVVALTALAGCSTHPTKQEIGTATGAVVGGVAGAVLPVAAPGVRSAAPQPVA